MNIPNADFARAMADALEKAGIVSDIPENDPNPLWAAQQAFLLCWGHDQIAAWRELKDRLTAPSVPRAAYFRKLAELCHQALRRPDVPEDLREAVAFGWGYFSAMLKAEITENGQARMAVDG